MKLCVFGLGDSGSALAGDLVVAGADVTAYDPAPVATPAGVQRLAHPALAAARSDLILGVTTEADAEVALLQALDVFPENVVYADLSTAKPALKQELASLAASAGVRYADVATTSNGVRGLFAPSLVCGDGADRYAEVIAQLGGRTEVIVGVPGAATRRQVLKATVLAGTAAVMAEVVSVAEGAEDLDWLWTVIRDELGAADDAWLRQQICSREMAVGHQLSQVEAAKTLIQGSGLRPTMSEALSRSLREGSLSATLDADRR